MVIYYGNFIFILLSVLEIIYTFYKNLIFNVIQIVEILKEDMRKKLTLPLIKGLL
jgi:hypothetical protein